ncbi:MAG TPA: type II secretion system F family protein [Oscillatoriaceae cyanobacterium]
MTPLILVSGSVTVALAVWAIATIQRRGPSRSRWMRYAVEPNIASVGLGPTARLPKGWEAFIARTGLEWSPKHFAIAATVAAMLGLVLGLFVGLPLLGAPAGVVALYFWLRFLQRRRVRTMAEQLPNALMLMANAIKSGLGFQQALQIVGDEGAAPLAPEFARLGQDLALGLKMEDALMRLQTRLGSIDGEILASALLVQRQTGGNLSEILQNLHTTIRDRQTVMGQVRTLTAQGRLSGLVLTLIPVFIALALYMLNRSYLMVLVHDPRGQMLSGIALVLMLIGVFWIRKIVTIPF